MLKPREFSYWVIPNQFLAGNYPRSRDIDQSKIILNAFLSFGINHFINLTYPKEVEGLEPYDFLLDDLSSSNESQVKISRFQIDDGYPPESPMLMNHILDTIDHSLCLGDKIYIHCWGGMGRTGMVVACWLSRHFNGKISNEPDINCFYPFENPPPKNGYHLNLMDLWCTNPKSTRYQESTKPTNEIQSAFIDDWLKYDHSLSLRTQSSRLSLRLFNEHDLDELIPCLNSSLSADALVVERFQNIMKALGIKAKNLSLLAQKYISLLFAYGTIDIIGKILKDTQDFQHLYGTIQSKEKNIKILIRFIRISDQENKQYTQNSIEDLEKFQLSCRPTSYLLNQFGMSQVEGIHTQDHHLPNLIKIHQSQKNLKIQVNGVEFNMCYCPEGSFVMGVHTSNDDNVWWNRAIPATKMFIKNPFWIGETQVTQSLWQAVMHWNPSIHIGNNLPVENVTWYDCLLFCNQLSQLEGLNTSYKLSHVQKDGEHVISADVTWILDANGYRLLTEVEWEYAAKTISHIPEFPQRGYFYNKIELEKKAWYADNSKDYSTNLVKSKEANDWGIYDMSGNVWEWCHDRYDENALRNPEYLKNKYMWQESPCIRSCRGGSFLSDAEDCQVEFRRGFGSIKSKDRGFRLFKYVT